MQYNNYRELQGKTLQDGDIVILRGRRHEVRAAHLYNMNGANSWIFDIFGISDRTSFAEQHYGYAPCGGTTTPNWPETKYGDFAALTRLVLAIFAKIEGITESTAATPAPEHLSIDNIAIIALNENRVADIEKQLAAWKAADEARKEAERKAAEEAAKPKTMADIRKILCARQVDGKHYFVSGFGDVHSCGGKITDCGGFPTDKRTRQLVALHNLMQVADALNGVDGLGIDGGAKWKFVKDERGNLDIDNYALNSGGVYFKDKPTANQARQILGDDVIKTALGH